MKLLTHHHGGSKVDEDGLPNGSPSSRALKQGSRWDHFRIEVCGGDKILLDSLLKVTEILGIYRPGIRSNRGSGGGHMTGGAANLWPRHQPMWLPHGSPRPLPKLLGSLIVQKKLSKSFAVFGLP